MSDHLSGTRALADPAIDLTDLFAFPSPSQGGLLVLVMNVFPNARPGALFSDAASYEELVGFVPPRVKARFARAEAAGPVREEVLHAQETVRNRVMYPDCLDQRTVQLVLTGILHSKLSDAATLHGLAARRAGATDEQLQAVIDLAYLFTGMSAANRGPALLESIDELEAKTR
ncbi:DUF4331 family protein [Streptomyces sp. NPDC005480]|uniref:carboxymuconolactone decarboxylase family protein n=1 Tax=Streptomyces sp. NPDC005480 TaxID=3154880 RepID=UPI0033B8A9F0